MLREALERFTGNSSVQTNAPDECEQAEQALALTAPDAEGQSFAESLRPPCPICNPSDTEDA